jgi:hypothetical protein
MMDTAHGLRHWFVVFQDRPDNAPAQWFHRFIPPKVAHVWAYAWHPDTGIYLTIDPRGNHLFIQPIPVAQHPNDAMLEVATRPGVRAIVLYAKDERIPFKLCGHWVYSCVSVLKDLLGIRAAFVLTPHQLFRKVLKNGGVIMFKEGEL